MNILKCINLLVLLICITPFSASGQSRTRRTINSNWQFFKGDSKHNSIPQNVAWEIISLPHSYNTEDVLDDEPGYYRGEVWYRKHIHISESDQARKLFLFFEGVNQVAQVYINGQRAGEHRGGYTAFRIPVNPFLNSKDSLQEVVVRVTNAYDPDIPPLTADFTFFGGIYRDVYLEAIDPVHFDVSDLASGGLKVTTPIVSNERAVVNVMARCVNESNERRQLIVTSTLYQPDGIRIANQQTRLSLKPGESAVVEHTDLSVKQPHLWSPEQPELYNLVVEIRDKNSGSVIDQVGSAVGFRWFSFDSDKGFFLNGKPYKLWGTSRHQDYPHLANALPDALHVRDIELLKEMGGNFLRVAHYPQDPSVLQACDRLGILTSVEIPVVNAITESEAFTANALVMQREMIHQNFNHPSVICWAYMNEVLLRLPFTDNKPRQEIYLKNVEQLARKLDSLTRREDPSRVTMMAFHGNYNLYKSAGLIDIPMVDGWNLYQGWYGGNINGFAGFLDEFHEHYPRKPFLITEYGADGDPRLRSFSPERFDKTIEYETYYHKVYIKAIAAREFVSGAIVWNLADFNSETRAETMPHINNKGLLDSGRHPKDAYLFYQAFLSKAPYLAIGSRMWELRSGVALSEDSLFSIQPVEVYTNSRQPVELRNNNILVGSSSPVDGVAVFHVPFVNGVNRLEARASDKDVGDHATINFQLLPQQLRSSKLPFESINVNVGDKRFYTCLQRNEVWLPDQPYEKGSWGYLGGEVFSLKNKNQPYGTDRDIKGTGDDPVYATQRVGIREFRFDVPDGRYEVTLHFAELLGGPAQEALIYNLSDTSNQQQGKFSDRSFNVKVNGETILQNLGNTNELYPERAFSTRTTVIVTNNGGITIEFEPLEGESLLSGVQVRKL